MLIIAPVRDNGSLFTKQSSQIAFLFLSIFLFALSHLSSVRIDASWSAPAPFERRNPCQMWRRALLVSERKIQTNDLPNAFRCCLFHWPLDGPDFFLRAAKNYFIPLSHPCPGNSRWVCLCTHLRPVRAEPAQTELAPGVNPFSSWLSQQSFTNLIPIKRCKGQSSYHHYKSGSVPRQGAWTALSADRWSSSKNVSLMWWVLSAKRLFQISHHHKHLL